jgi:hypothetical protein
VILTLFLFFIQFQSAFSQSEFSSERSIGDRPVKLTASDPGRLEICLRPENIERIERVLRNLALFEQETENSYFVNTARIELEWLSSQGPESKPSALAVTALSRDDESEIRKRFRLEQIRFSENDAVVSFTVTPEREKPEDRPTYRVTNIRRDSRGNILKRILVKISSGPAFRLPADFEKFLEGVLLEYRDFNEFGKPMSYQAKTFVLDQTGRKRWVQVKESLNRRFNESGRLLQETVRETRYSYGEPMDSDFAVYNVRIDPATGDLGRFDLIFSPPPGETPLPRKESFEILFEPLSNSTGIKKIVRKYDLEQGAKRYLSGQSIELYQKGSRISFFRETSFQIKPGTPGLLDEDRIYESALYLYNLEFNEENKVLHKRIVELAFVPRENGETSLPVFHTFRDVRYTYQNGDPKRLDVDFLDFNENRRLGIARQLSIEVLETMKTGDPVKIRLVIKVPADPAMDTEQVIIQDCRYILNEAVTGDLFYAPTERSFHVRIKNLSPEGEIQSFEILENAVPSADLS